MIHLLHLPHHKFLQRRCILKESGDGIDLMRLGVMEGGDLVSE